MKVLITGGGGFIGSHLVDSQLAHGHQVRTIDRHVERLAHLEGHPGLQVIVGDITESAALERLLAGVDVVYHLASAHLDVSLSDSDYHKVNVEASISVAQAARASGARRMVQCSSVGVMGDITHPPANESAPCDPTNVYEKTKLAGEREVLQFARETGFSIAVARPAWVYGPRCPRTEKLFRTIEKGHFVLFGTGRNLRHPLYVADVIRGLELCAEVDCAAGQVYILAGDMAVQVDTLVRAVAETLGVRPPIVHLPLALGWAAGYAFETVFGLFGKSPPYSRRSMDFFVKNNAYDTQKARQELGFQPQVNLQAGLAKTKHWFYAGQRCSLGSTDRKGVQQR